MMNAIGRSLRLVALLLIATLAARAGAAVIPVLSGAGWRSTDVLTPGWESPGFDDSGWAYARAPYPGLASPQDVIPGTLATPMWHDPAATSNGMSGPDTAFFRYSFPISGLPGSGVVAVNVDDDYRFYVNGTLAFENRDGGYAQIVDHVDVSSLLREGLNTFAIMAVDGALAGPYDRLFERVLLDGQISTVDTRVSLNGTPILPELIPPLGLGDVLQAQGALHVPLQVGAGATLEGTDHLLVTRKIGIANGSIGMSGGKTLQLKEQGSIDGFGAMVGKLLGSAGSTIKVAGGDLRLGKETEAVAVDHDGDIHVEAGRTLDIKTKEKAALGGKTTLAGGNVKVDAGKFVELKKGAAIEGHGALDAKLTGAFGSAIKVAGGDLRLGKETEAVAVDHDGDIHVEAGRTLDIKTKEKAALGGKTTLAGGNVKVDVGKVVELKKGAAIEGHGALEGKVAGGAGSAIRVTGGDLRLGKETEAMAVVHDGDIQIEAGRALLAESLDAVMLGGKVNLAGARLGAKNGIGIRKEGRLSGTGAVQGAVTSEGVISPGASFGALQFEDGLALWQDSVLELELGLLGGVLSFDQLRVDGTLSLGGLLRIILTDDYLPSAGDFADFLVADSVASAFASLELIAPGRQLAWTAGVVDLPDARQAWRFEILSAQAVSEPPALALVGVALLACVGRRRRPWARRRPS